MPGVALGGFYGPGRAVWDAPRAGGSVCEVQPSAPLQQNRELPGCAAQRRTGRLPLVFVPYLKNVLTRWLGTPAPCRRESQRVAEPGIFVRGVTRRGLTGRSEAQLCESIAAKRRVWSNKPERPTPRGFLSQCRCAPGAVLRTENRPENIECRWRVSRGKQRPSDSAQGEQSTAKSEEGRKVRLAGAFATVAWKPNVKEQTAEPVLLLNALETAKALGICRRTLEREIQRGRFPRPVKIGSASRWPLADVSSYVATLTAERAT